jgi:serine/threonine-protein kinase
MLEVGSVVGGKLRIERILGQGGMGVVAIAMHLQLEQRVAVKVLHDHLAADPATVERFLREARTPMRLRSEHVCRVLDVGQLEGGAPYIVMELLAGSDLHALVRARGALSLPTAADYVLQAMVAVAEAHALGIVHRDLKPANLMMTRAIDGSALVKVLDFGIAKSPARGDIQLTSTAAILGSPGYMSPEQLRSAKDVDARSDIWALGTILYELVSARLPFPATSVTELAMKVAVDPPDPLDVDPAFRAIVFRCLEKDPARRYQQIDALARDLAPFAGARGAALSELIGKLLARTSDTIPATPYRGAPTVSTTLEGAAGQPKTKPKRPRGLVIAIGAAAALAGASLGGYELAQRSSSSTRPVDAQSAAVYADAPIDVAPPPDAADVVSAPIDAPPPRRPPPRPTTPVDAAPPRAVEDARVPLPQPVAPGPTDEIKELHERMTENARQGYWEDLLHDTLERLKVAPDDPVALYYVVLSACRLGDAATAKKYGPKLAPKPRNDLAKWPCGSEGIDITSP